VAVAEWSFAETAGEETPPAPAASGKPVPTGDPLPMRCRERGCAAPAVGACAYVDALGQACGTLWCHQHLRPVAGGQYCRRHAGTMIALGTKAADPRVLPPVDHRGASLVSWVFDEGHSLLNPAVLAAVGPGEIVFEDRNVNVSRSTQGGRRWERGWSIGNRRGPVHRVVLRVDERDDATVLLVVDERAVAKGVPPWIGRRRRAEPLPPEGDRRDRRQFYEFLERFLRQSLSPGAERRRIPATGAEG
jgi:hypothetical protein